MSEQIEELTSKELPVTVLRNLKNLKDNQKLCDFNIEVDDLVFPVHRSHLAACSDYFRALLLSDSIESKQGKVTIEEITADTMKDVIEFCYTSSVSLTTANVQEILFAASFLQMHQLLSLAVAFIKDRVEVENCVGILNIADRCNLEDLYELALGYCLEEFPKVSHNEEFLQLDEEIFSKIISHDRLDINDESEVFHSIIRWIEADVGHRKEYLHKLLTCVRLVNLKSSSLVAISHHQYVRESQKCRDMLEAAKDYLLVRNLNSDERKSGDCQNFDERPRSPERTRQRIYALGGWTNEFKPTETMEIYDPYTDLWKEGPPMFKPRCGVGAAIIGNSLYAVGGHDGTHYLDCVERFDITTNTWHQDVAPMFKGRTSVGVVALNGYIYTIGGQTTQESVADVERYDPRRNVWKRLAPMHEKRLGPGVAVLDEKIYVIGGFSDGYSGSIEIYYPEEDCWRQPQNPNPFKRKHLGCAALDGGVVAVGGRNDLEEVAKVEKFSQLGTNLAIMPSINSPRSGVGLVALDDRLYAMGGCHKDVRLNTVEMFEPEENEWFFCCPMRLERLGGGFAVYTAMKTKRSRNKNSKP